MPPCVLSVLHDCASRMTSFSCLVAMMAMFTQGTRYLCTSQQHLSAYQPISEVMINLPTIAAAKGLSPLSMPLPYLDSAVASVQLDVSDQSKMLGVDRRPPPHTHTHTHTHLTDPRILNSCKLATLHLCQRGSGPSARSATGCGL